MAAYVEQLECLHCSQSRTFVLQGERERRILGQAEAARVAEQVLLTCGRCGSSSLIRSRADALPDATASMAPRRRRRRPSVVQDS
ncbi:MAG TPA: hypothetical protein VHB98_02435 [Chloroflexota bacterium]|nr:hypothetical protein [Chloroflexota bacterium]